jgi:hypothetical protein
MAALALVLTVFCIFTVVYCNPVIEVSCDYGEYSKWKTDFRPAPTHQCASGYVVVEKRNRTTLAGDCDDQTEERIAECAPEQSLRLAMLLDLGGAGQNMNSLGIHATEGSGRFGRGANLPWDDEDYHMGRHVHICHNRGRRNDDADDDKVKNHEYETQPHSIPEPQPLENDPVEFDIHKHGHRYRRTTQCEVQHVLFLLDTSGSIRKHDFRRLTTTLGDLVPLFCKSIEIAAMTFSQNHFLEFCFNEFDNDCAGRFAARRAIRSIRYRGGTTHTAEAVQCAFDNILTPSCGLAQDAECISIVFFTDGMSNGPGNVCEVVERLKQRRKFESFSVGIGESTNQDELRCLASDADNNLFQFPSFGQFVKELGMIESVFAKTGFSCVNPVGSKPSETFDDTGSECTKFSFQSGDGSGDSSD